eukprot:1140293-Pelagomonas_calceolata.AAC.1
MLGALWKALPLVQGIALDVVTAPADWRRYLGWWEAHRVGELSSIIYGDAAADPHLLESISFFTCSLVDLGVFFCMPATQLPNLEAHCDAPLLATHEEAKE